MKEIEAQMRSLTARLHAGLATLPHLHILGPQSWECSSSLTTIHPINGTLARCQEMVNTLREEHRIITKVRPEVTGIRISVAAFNTEQEIDTLLNALAHLAQP
jgi:selenocysteine lyase/cysteine desulfurase